ncbi:MAG: hypothetical protein Q8K30_01430 [Candidatus Gracilibacteria bacterium]|nr:hypothetical protein [Candidatus Gracilibacteria bacterium]
MKKVLKFLIILAIFINYFSVNADYVLCDTLNINVNSNYTDEICNGGNKANSFSGEFVGNFINYIPGYWGTNNYYQNLIDLNNNISFGFFDSNKLTVISKNNPEYSNIIGYIGANNILEKNINLLENLSIGFFDNIKSTIISKNNPEYSNYIGFLRDIDLYLHNTGNDDIINNTGSLNNSENIAINNITKKDFYHKLFTYYTISKIEISDKDYNLFINNMLNLLLSKNELSDSGTFISIDLQNKIFDNISKSNFDKNIIKLLNSYEDINYIFGNYDINVQIFLINYIISN